MKAKTITGLAVLFMVFTSLSLSAQKPDFTGEWKLNREKTALTDNSLFLSGITIKIKADTLFTTRVYENSNGEQYPFDENVTLDGKEARITIYDMPRVTKASGVNSDGSVLVESKTTFYNNGSEDNLVAKETWKIAGEMLTIEFTNSMSAGSGSGTLYFAKVK
ncbi:MAG: hypothetical protein IPH69_01475 [Bacteroidales bacterium]|nr:hypothetical protein [Bacteroidales bacterium]MBK7628870.1 hypothetical protein [Bacteroidales bacterium]